MDIFTDVDIFKEIVEASARGISVYILLDESKFSHFLSMTEKQGCQVQRLRVRILHFVCFLQVLSLCQMKGTLSYITGNVHHIFKVVTTERSPCPFQITTSSSS